MLACLAHQVIIRSIGFLYHLSITVLFTTFTELLLVFFKDDYGRAAKFLGCVAVLLLLLLLSHRSKGHGPCMKAVEADTAALVVLWVAPACSMCLGIERLMQFFTVPLLGNVSDSMGRKGVLLLSLVLHMGSLFCATFTPGWEGVLIYYIVNGACNVTLTICNAVVTDLAIRGGEVDLTRQYGRLGMAVGLALVLGPAIGPSLSKLDIRYPLYLAISALGLCVLLW